MSSSYKSVKNKIRYSRTNSETHSRMNIGTWLIPPAKTLGSPKTGWIITPKFSQNPQDHHISDWNKNQELILNITLNFKVRWKNLQPRAGWRTPLFLELCLFYPSDFMGNLQPAPWKCKMVNIYSSNWTIENIT